MNKFNRIVFVALRDNLGATGGPGGVLYIQQQILGDNLCGKETLYRFNFIKTRNVKAPSIRRVLNMVLFFFYFLFQKKTYYIAHDVETGRILSLLHKSYSLIFHHQGSVVKERMELAGKPLTPGKVRYFQNAERKALVGAKSLHFPSNGAAEMYFNSEYASCKRVEVSLGVPLYNVILQTEVKTPQNISIEKDSETLTFFSLGTLTKAKGQDNTVEFLAKFIPEYEKPMRYILVGSGPLKDQLITRLEGLKATYGHFTYLYYERLSHDEVMYIHKISDIYIMLHRVSIFDFATLEAMSQESAVILSKVGGNPEYNREDNVIFAEDVSEYMKKLADCNFDILKEKNKAVFDKYFSAIAFKAQYEKLLMSCI